MTRAGTMRGVRRLLSVFSDRSGASAVEFALIAAPLMLLLVGTIEVGRLFWTQHAIDEAAIAGARCMGIRAPACADAGGAFDQDTTKTHVVAEARSMGVALDSSNVTAD